MLISLKINNVALINSANIQFKNGFNVLSGETGAGKSIVIDSLNFVLGQRADKSLIKTGEEFSRVEAVFEVDIENEHIVEFFALLNMEPEDTVIINRYMSVQGKNDIKVNGETVTLNMLKKLTMHLVDIHGQHEHQALLDVKNHLLLLDNLKQSEIEILLGELKFALKELENINNSIRELGGVGTDRQRNIDLLTHEISEIEMANLQENEEEDLKTEKINLLNFEKIFNNLTEMLSFIKNEDVSALSLLKNGITNLNTLSTLNNKFLDAMKRLQSCGFELEDVCDEMDSYLATVEYSDNKLNEIEERLDLYRDMKRKYGTNYEDIMNYLNQSKIKMQKLLNSEEELVKLNITKQNKLSLIFKIATNITEFRKQLAQNIELKVVDNLKDLGMKNAQFKVFFDNVYTESNIETNITPLGADSVEFMFSANIGEPAKSLSKIISGGEMSRFMLAFKCVLHEKEPYKTLVFDEIDTGIGGTIGTVVAEKMDKLSKSNQVVCVTHLAQIACYADINFKIEKLEMDGKTLTQIILLNDEQKLLEVSRMLGSNSESEISKMHALELIETAKIVKSN